MPPNTDDMVTLLILIYAVVVYYPKYGGQTRPDQTRPEQPTGNIFQDSSHFLVLIRVVGICGCKL